MRNKEEKYVEVSRCKDVECFRWGESIRDESRCYEYVINSVRLRRGMRRTTLKMKGTRQR